MAGPRARALSLALVVATLLARGVAGQTVDEPPADGSVADLVAKLDPARPDPVRLQAVVLLGHLGGNAALQALARALDGDPYPPVRSGAALALGQSGDARWVRALAQGLDDAAPLVQKAARVAIKSLVQRLRDGKDHLARYTCRVDVRGLKDRSGADDNDLTVWYQEGATERLAKEPGITLGETLDFDTDVLPPPPAAIGSAGPGDLDLLLDGGVLEYELSRDDAGARAWIRGDMQVFLEPVHEPLSDRVEGQHEERLSAEVSAEEAIEAVALPLSRDLFDGIWSKLR